MGAKLGGGSFDEMNLTPLIDIVLVVLIIMMVSIPIQVEEMGVKLPSQSDSAPPPPSDDPPEQLVIAVYENGDLALNRRLMPEDILFDEVSRRLRSMTKKNVFVDGHPDIAYGQVIDMIDLAREAGAAKVGFAKLKDEGPSEPTSAHSGARPRGVSLGNPRVVGILSPKYADSVIMPSKGQLRGCYEQALATNPALSGRVVLKVEVGPDGSQNEMAEPSINSTTLENEMVETCLTEVAKTLLFSASPPGGDTKTAVVYFPMLFSPG